MRCPVLVIGALLSLALCSGCVSSGPDNGALLRNAKHPAWSIDAAKDEMVVAVSPARQTLQLAGSTGIVLGMSISAISDAKSKKKLNEVLEGYEPALIFEERLSRRLREVLGEDLAHVAPLTSTVGYHDKREAERSRYYALSREGHDMILDLKMSFGLFGYEGLLIAKLDGVLLSLPKQKKLWQDSIVVSAEAILASDKLGDPTNRLKPNITSPRLLAADNAIEQWTQDGGALLRQQFESAVDGAISAILTDMNLVDEVLGNYYLAKKAMNKKNHEEAIALYRHVLELDPSHMEAKNGLSVSLAHHKELDEAMAMAIGMTTERPAYAPAWFNLAWWNAFEKDDLEAARPYYDKALSLGMTPHKKLDKAFIKAQEEAASE